MGAVKDQLLKTTSISGERINIRRANENDAPAMFEIFSDPATVEFIHVPQAKSVQDTLENSIRGFHMSDPLGKWVIALKDSDWVIGGIDLRLTPDEQDAEIGYVLGSKYTGQGYMTEAVQMLLKYSFETLGLSKIHSFHATENPKSGAVMQRAGMHFVKLIPNHEEIDGVKIDSLFYEINHHEYDQQLFWAKFKKLQPDAQFGSAWAFGDFAEMATELAQLVLDGTKTATASAYVEYQLEDEALPEAFKGYDILLNGNDEPVAILQTTQVKTVPFNKVDAEHAFKEGEGDRSLEYWRNNHLRFWQQAFAEKGLEFDPNQAKIVLEEFKVVYK
ncbi:MAG: GNAT family N-acetyltransferase [Lactobacillaceae bacterium]|jgi:ribosomal-protein-alanine N-acetyltransferase|nr:GNAT family N-acetyltransferase [Lactobacillaceae bacterium]